MSNARQQRWGQYKFNVLKILAESSEGIHWSLVFKKLDEIMPPEVEELEHYKSSDVPRRNGNIRFSTIALVKAGWMTRSRGIWAITEEGRQALIDFPSADAIQKAASRIYGEWRASQDEEQASEESASSIELMVSIDEAEESARDVISTFMSNMDPYTFQDLVATLLEAMSYHVSWIAPPGKDGGMDIVAYQDPLGATGSRIKVQVKRRADKVGVDAVRSLMGIIGENDIGLFISTGGFSPDAERLVREHDTKRLKLVDGQQFFDLWVEYYDKLSHSSRALMPLRPIYHLDLPK